LQAKALWVRVSPTLLARRAPTKSSSSYADAARWLRVEVEIGKPNGRSELTAALAACKRHKT
jgi:hypothetical protein